MLALKREKESLEAHIEKLKGQLETCECAPLQSGRAQPISKFSFGLFSQYSSCHIMP